MQEKEQRTPTSIIHNDMEVNSPKEIAKAFIEKVDKIRKNIHGDEFKAVNLFKELIPWVENNWTLKTVTVDHVYTHILKMRKDSQL